MWDVYSVGNATFLIEIYRGLARLWSTGDIYQLFSVALIIGIIWNSLLWAINQEKHPFPAKGFVLSIIFVVGLLGPQSLVDVRVTSKRDATFEEINNVPLLPALGGWLITNSGTKIADLLAQAFSTPGIANTWEALSPIQHFVGLSDTKMSDACTPNKAAPSYNVCSTLENYLEDCYVLSNLITPSASEDIDSVLNADPKNILSSLKVKNVNLFTVSHLVPSEPNGAKQTCPVVWDSLKRELDSPQFKENLKKAFAAQGTNLGKVDVFITQLGSQGVLPAAETSYDLANAAFFRSIFNDYFPNSEYGTQVSRAMFDTVRQRQLANASKKEYWMENAEVMQSFFETLTVFLTPFLGLVLAVSGQGLMAVGQYMAAWVFVQLWSVMIVLVNLFTALAMTGRFNESIAAGKNQFSLSAIDSQFATANSYISISGMLYTFIPAICVFVLYRGVHAMQGMSKQAMADPSIDSKRLSPDTGTAINNGNATWGGNTSQLEASTGRHLNGDNLLTTSMGQTTVNGSFGTGASSGASRLKADSQTLSNSATNSLDSLFTNSRASDYKFSDDNSTSFTANTMSEYMTAGAKAVQQATGWSDTQSQQFFAAASGTAKGEFSLGAKAFDTIGAKVSADLQAGLGLRGAYGEENSSSLAKSLNLTESQLDKISHNMSQIHTAGDSSSFSDASTVAETAKSSAALMRQSQAMEQQGLMLNEMVSNSSQVSSSKQIDKAGLAASLLDTDLPTFIQNQNKDLWEQIQKAQIDGLSGDQWLQQAQDDRFIDRQGKAVNPLSEARAEALFDFIARNDAIQLSNNGLVDTNKEKEDAQINKGLFEIMSNSGVVNASDAAALYDEKAKVMDKMAMMSDSIVEKEVSLSQAPVLQEPTTLSSDMDKLRMQADGSIDAVERNIKNASDAVEREHNQGQESFRTEGEVLTKGPVGTVSKDELERIEQSNATLADSKGALTDEFNATNSIVAGAANFIKPDADQAFSNFVESQVNGGADISSYKPKDGESLVAAADIKSYENGSINDMLTSHDSQLANRAFDIVNILSNDQLMTDILGKNENGTYGQGSDLGKTKFKSEDLETLSEGANWAASYVHSQETHAITSALNDSASDQGNPVQTYLTAMQNLSDTQAATDTSNGQVMSSETSNAAEDLSNFLRQFDKGNEAGQDYVLYEATGGTQLTDGTFYYPAEDRFEERMEINSHINNMKDLASNMDHILSDEQKEALDGFFNQAEERMKTDTGDRAGYAPMYEVGGRE